MASIACLKESSTGGVWDVLSYIIRLSVYKKSPSGHGDPLIAYFPDYSAGAGATANLPTLGDSDSYANTLLYFISNGCSGGGVPLTVQVTNGFLNFNADILPA